ncbi:uncharacterized protein LOC110436302 [Sorghum bicolor]|uniref:uncharacterized protein LOC110436302 n=1 Tax=Sorghum bicolor TaxID=4558 RepID=UPI000B42430E|nr:uncharacterized protein LOC110436302 [Sorghum bicolor]|eukprot:XP_021318668.1 uncharacterized protein LOC110436302 [Sorghum bicolor]
MACFVPSDSICWMFWTVLHDCKPCNTHVDTHSKLSIADGMSVSNSTNYRNITGTLQYLTFTRSEIAYAVQQVCLRMHIPRDPHLGYTKRILRYLQGSKGNKDLSLHLYQTLPIDLIVYSDANWAGCPGTRKSTSSYAIFCGDNLILWSSKRPTTVFGSSAEAKYRVVANVIAQALATPALG